MNFEEVFREATGNEAFSYQSRLATQELPELIDIPTGLGKTASIILSWVFKRRILKDVKTPRRLVYCLPMRVLVEQTQRCTEGWLKNLGLLGHPGEGMIAVYLLMGGQVDLDWALYPEADAILIGTQDMLLSRALNRGYAARRARWPIEFGLLSNDCLWVYDEVQLMGSGLATSAQLQAFQSKLWAPMLQCRSIWMSATINADGLETSDRLELGCGVGEPFCLTPAERESEGIRPRLYADKKIRLSDNMKPPSSVEILDNHKPGRISIVVVNTVSSSKDWFLNLKSEIESRSKGKRADSQPELYLLHSRFRPLDRETAVTRILEFIQQTDSTIGAVCGHAGIVLVTTQVIEAGFDVSAVRLWSEIAPWPSCIQRLGRLNREGLQPFAEAVFWMPSDDKKGENAPESPNAKRVGPYEKIDLENSKALLGQLQELTSRKKYREALDTVLSGEESRKALHFEREAVIRQDDLYGLFSTEPDLAGGFTDVSHFVRDQDRNSDVHLFWRQFESRGGPSSDEPAPTRDEVVPIPFYELRRFLDSQGRAWEWDFENGCWEGRYSSDIHPGMTLLLACSHGGYSDALGWTGEAGDCPSQVVAGGVAAGMVMPEALDLEPESQLGGWLSLDAHLKDVEATAKGILAYLDLLDTPEGQAVMIAARWHDRGKSLPRWQRAVLDHVWRVAEKCRAVLENPGLAHLHDYVRALFSRIGRPEGSGICWAKWPDVREAWLGADLAPESVAVLKKTLNTQFRPGLRHEAASALAAWDAWRNGEEGMTGLSVFLIAAHHGKVRTVLLSTSRRDAIFGLQEGDALSPSSFDPRERRLQFELRKIGLSGEWLDDGTFVTDQPSWTTLVAELLGTEHAGIPGTFDAVSRAEPRGLGPFKLAYLEALLRASDIRASIWPNGGR